MYVLLVHVHVLHVHVPGISVQVLQCTGKMLHATLEKNYTVSIPDSTHMYIFTYYITAWSIVRFESGKKVTFWNPPPPSVDLVA